MELWCLPSSRLNPVALISLTFLCLYYAYGSALQLTLINQKEEIVGFIRKLCIHMSPKAELQSSSAQKPRLIGICEKVMTVTFYGIMMNTVCVATTAAYQLDGSKLVERISFGISGRPMARIAFLALHIHMAYNLWSLNILLALPFFAVAFTVMVSLNDLMMQVSLS